MMMTQIMMIMTRRTSMTMMIIMMMQEVTITETMMAVIKFEFFLGTDILDDRILYIPASHCSSSTLNANI